jgi:hypothetical protein
MPTYRPASPDPLILSLGTWSAPLLPDKTVTLTIDPRIFTWLVNQAAHRTGLFYVVAQGKPPITVTLT